MSRFTQILLVILTIVSLLTVGIVLYKQSSNNKQISAVESTLVEQKQLLDNISRAQSQYASKEDINAFAKAQNINLDVIKNNLETLGATVQGINGITVISNGQNTTEVPSTGTTPRPDTPSPEELSHNPYGYLSNTQHLAISEMFSNIQIPVGNVGFSAWKDKPWDVQIIPRKYSVTSVLGADNDGKHYSYSKFSIRVNDKSYDVKIDNNEFIEEYPSSTFSWFNPKLFLTAGGGINVSKAPVSASANGGVTLGIMSYGQFKNNPSISILQIGAAYQTASKLPSVVLSPINFNIGKLLPFGLINNTYIGPSMQLDTTGNIMVGVNGSVGL